MECGLDSTGSGQGHVAGSCDELLGIIRGGGYLDQLNIFSFLELVIVRKEVCAFKVCVALRFGFTSTYRTLLVTNSSK
jgi:hypothetical protein